MASVEKLVSELEDVDKEIVIAAHSYHRSKQRNIDLKPVKRKIKKLDIYSVRKNNQRDPRYSKTYKIVVKDSESRFYEIPIYFNPNGNEVYVKSVWNK